MTQDQDKNIVNLNDARKRQRPTKVKPLKDKPAKKGGQSMGGKAWGYIQLLLFLVVIAYMMHRCRV